MELTHNLISAVVVLTLSRDQSDEQRFKQFTERIAKCMEVLERPEISGTMLEAAGWKRWLENSKPIWVLCSARILWSVDKGLTLFLAGKMISER